MSEWYCDGCGVVKKGCGQGGRSRVRKIGVRMSYREDGMRRGCIVERHALEKYP